MFWMRVLLVLGLVIAGLPGPGGVVTVSAAPVSSPSSSAVSAVSLSLPLSHQPSTTFLFSVQQDTYLYEGSASQNFGAAAELLAQTHTGGQSTRPVLRFDLSQIPDRAQVLSATAYLYVTQRSVQTLSLHRVTTAWAENTATWTALAAAYDPSIAGSLAPNTKDQFAGADVTALVQDWVIGGLPNYGLMMVADTLNSETRYASKEWATAAQRPYLEVVIATESVTLDAQKDGGIWKSTDTKNYGTCGIMTLDTSGGNVGNGRLLLQFDLGSLPNQIAIMSAQLQVTKVGGVNTSHDIRAYPLAAAWDEGSGGCLGDNQPVSWTERQPSILWTQVGGDYDATPAAATTVTTNAQYTWDVTGLVNQWQTGSRPNHGLLLGTPDTGVDLFLFATREASDPTLRPRLVITYAATTGTIAGQVWDDINRNALLDSGESGLAQVSMELYPGLCGIAPAAPSQRISTSADGHYWFADLTDGDYCVRVDEDTLPPSFGSVDDKNPVDLTLNSAANPAILGVNFAYATTLADDRLTVGTYAPCTDYVWLQTLAVDNGATLITADTSACDFTFVVPAANLDALAAAIAATPKDRHGYVDLLGAGQFIPNDPDYNNVSIVYGPQQINAPAAWDLTLGDPNLILAVLDTGMDLTHPEFAGRIVPGYDFVNKDSDPTDDNGHGTHVAGIAAAGINNALGMAGVAGQVKIMPIKVLNASNLGWMSDVAAGITYAVDNGAKVINLSLTASAESLAVRDAITYAISKGVVVIAAAGNNNSATIGYPAVYDTVIAVGATTYTNERWTLSNYGPDLDVVAPGSLVWSADRGGGFQFMSGTSMSAPHAAGLAALLLSVNPNLTPVQIKSAMQETATDMGAVGWDTLHGYGQINAGAAVASITPAVFVPPVTSLVVTLVNDLNGNGLADPGDTLRYEVVAANGNPTPLTGVVVSGDLPAFSTYVAGSTALNGIPVLDGADITAPSPLEGDGLTIGSIPAKNSNTIAYDVVVGSLPKGVYTLSAEVVVSTESGLDVLTAETEVAGTLLHAQVDPLAAQAGDTLSYVVTTDFVGDDLLQNVVITAPIPAGTSYVPGSANAGGSESGGVVTWDLGGISSGVQAPGPVMVGNVLAAAPTLVTAGDLITVTQVLTESERPASWGMVDVRIAASADDAEEIGPTGAFSAGPGSTNLISADLELVEDIEPTTRGTQTVGMRFNGIGVPRGATITNAYITLQAVEADSPNTNSNSASLTFHGQAADNASAFTTAGNPNYDISNRPRTSASVGWGPQGWTSGALYNTPDLTSMVQEIVNRAGWASGNSMAFIVTGTGSRSAVSYDGNPAGAPLLHIDWEMPAGYSTDLVTPTLVLTGTNGVSATLVSGPTPPSANVGASGATFTWVYQATDSGNIGQLTFGGSAKDGTNTWPTAQSNSVIVHPPLAFQVTVNNPAPVAAVRAIAFINDSGDLLPSHASNTAVTTLPASLGGRVWNDSDGDMIQDAVEEGIGGVTVLLTDSRGDILTQVSGGDGFYTFANLTAGVYTVTVDHATVPPIYEFLTTRLALQITLGDGEANTNAAIGFKTRTSSIGDTIYYDADGDGVQDAGEPGLGNISLELYLDDGDGLFEPVPALGSDTFIGATVSNAAGAYRLDAPVAGSYFVDVTDDRGLLAGLSHTVGGQSVTDPSPAIPVAVGQIVQNVDFGYVRLPAAGHAILGDQVWVDENGDHVRQLVEPAVIDTQVCATPNVGGGPICVQTDINGRYLLELPAGGYTVAPPSSPLGLTVTTPSPLAVILADGDQDLSGDFGFGGIVTPLGSIGGQIWQDLPVNGLVDGVYNPATELGLPNVSVDLIMDRNDDGAWDSGDVYVASLSDMGGIFRFKGLLAGAYLVRVSDTLHVLRRFAPTITPLTGSAPVDNANKPQPYAIPLAIGESNNLADFGYREYEAYGTGSTLQPGMIGDQLWYDADGNGQYEQSAGDQPLPGVTLEARSGGVVMATATTGGDGKYLLMDLPLGRAYDVVVTDLFGVLEKYQPTALGVTGLNNQNQAQPYATFLALASTDLKADFGYARLSSVGDRVWWDANQNGVQDAGEPGIPNVPLDLLDATDRVIRSTPTNALGNYSFTDLPKGMYTVTVNSAAFLSGGPLAGWTASPQGTTADSLDSDGDPDTHRAVAAPDFGSQLGTVDFGFNTPSAAEVTVSSPSFVRFGDDFQVSITITNTGNTWISRLPVHLTYDPAYVGLRGATPLADDLADTGEVTWADGLAGASGGLAPSAAGELAPGAATQLLVTFRGRSDSTGLPGETTPFSVTLMGGSADPDGSAGAMVPLPVVGQSVSSGGVIIVNPTGVQLVDTGVQAAADGVRLSWRTVDESRVAGFHLWRQAGTDAPVRITSAPLAAQVGGQPTGERYTFTDPSQPDGMAIYELELLLMDGASLRLPLGTVDGAFTLFLPLAIR